MELTMKSDREDRLQALQRDIAACRVCRDAPTRGPSDRLPHEPRPVVVLSATAPILIAGQAPGLRVHESGMPFTDASGDRLRQWLDVERESFYNTDHFAIVPMGFCFPGYDAKGSDLPPRRECAPLWQHKVIDAMPQVKLVIVVGQYAQVWHLGTARMPSVAATVANWRQYLFGDAPTAFLPLPHPSWRNSGWLKRNPWFEAELLPELRKRVKTLTS